jgi:hypothetical protein
MSVVSGLGGKGQHAGLLCLLKLDYIGSPQAFYICIRKPAI